jgi:hypothetical protein
MAVLHGIPPGENKNPEPSSSEKFGVVAMTSKKDILLYQCSSATAVFAYSLINLP